MRQKKNTVLRLPTEMGIGLYSEETERKKKSVLQTVSDISEERAKGRRDWASIQKGFFSLTGAFTIFI